MREAMREAIGHAVGSYAMPWAIGHAGGHATGPLVMLVSATMVRLRTDVAPQHTAVKPWLDPL